MDNYTSAARIIARCSVGDSSSSRELRMGIGIHSSLGREDAAIRTRVRAVIVARSLAIVTEQALLLVKWNIACT